VAEAAERARAGEGPTLLEFRTYRYKGHSMSDPAKYRTKEELEDYKGRDSIETVAATILKNGWATEEELEAIDDKQKQIVADAVKFAEDSPFPDPSELFTDIYVEPDYPYVMD
jgi:pyruvate dehydrogenase E1 component alpha subunit